MRFADGCDIAGIVVFEKLDAEQCWLGSVHAVADHLSRNAVVRLAQDILTGPSREIGPSLSTVRGSS